VLREYPEDAFTVNGDPFWATPKRSPQAIDFNPVDEDHARFCHAAAILKAQSCGIAKLPSWHSTLNTVTPRIVWTFSKSGSGMFWWIV